MCRLTAVLSTSVMLMALWLARGFARSEEAKPDAEAILKEVREKYNALQAYHFEHTILVEELKAGEKPQKIAEVTLITATERDKGPPRVFEGLKPRDLWADTQEKRQIPFNLERQRMEAKHARGDVVLACDGKTCWLFSGKTKEFKKGESLLKVLGPTAGTMYSALHGMPLMKFVDESLQSPKFVSEEEIKVGEERRACFVVEAVVKSKPLPLPEGVDPPEFFPRDYNPLAGAAGVLTNLQIHGLAASPISAARREARTTANNPLD